MTKQETTYAGMLGSLAQLTAALAANAGEIPHLEGVRGRLEKILAEAQEAAKQQAALTASKQETTKRLKSLLTEGQRMATGVRKLLTENYGLHSEKLAEFGLKPFRGRKVKEAPPGSPEVSPATHPTPLSAALPGADANPKL